MGQKVNPIGLRLGINRTWDSRWFAGKGEYGKLLHEDMAIRAELMKQLKQAAVSKIVIERPHKKCRVTIHSARPGVVIGKKGADIEKLRRKVADADRLRRRHQHRRDPQAGARRAAGRRIDRPAARAPRRLPPRHEARRAVGDAARRRGHPHQLLGPSRRRRDRAHGMVSRGPRAAAHAARRRRLRRRRPRSPPTAPAASRSGSSRARSSSTIRWRRTRAWPKAMPGVRAATRPDADAANETERR